MCFGAGVSFVMSITIFFFFKQKTAYEMRISDWSSDVCSSDLLQVEGRARRIVVEVAGDQRRVIDIKDALELVAGSARDRRVDLFDGGVLLGDELEVDQRHVRGRHADRRAVELALQGRQHQDRKSTRLNSSH